MLTPKTMRREARPDAVTVYLVERLGNQLFSYAAALAQARRLGVPCCANLGFYRHVRPERPYHYDDFDLGVFDHGLIIPDDPHAHYPVLLGYPSVRAATLWHNRLAPRGPGRLFGPPVFMERSFRYDPRVERVQPGTTMLGLFQSWRYHAEIGGELRERMTRLTAPSPWFAEMMRRIVPGEGQVALNVRRGEYVTHQQGIQGLATSRYYEVALRDLRRMGLNGSVFVASDSLADAMNELNGLADLVAIDPPPGTHPMEVLILLSRVDGLVAANSTFSWWAGFLGSRPDQIVIAPRPWLTLEQVDTRDLLPPEWLTLDREATGLVQPTAAIEPAGALSGLPGSPHEQAVDA